MCILWCGARKACRGARGCVVVEIEKEGGFENESIVLSPGWLLGEASSLLFPAMFPSRSGVSILLALHAAPTREWRESKAEIWEYAHHHFGTTAVSTLSPTHAKPPTVANNSPTRIPTSSDPAEGSLRPKVRERGLAMTRGARRWREKGMEVVRVFARKRLCRTIYLFVVAVSIVVAAVLVAGAGWV